MMGKVYLIGAGPGAADLITLRGAAVLKRAGVVFYDALVHPDTLALAPQARLVAVGKRCSRISTDQRFINRNLVEAAAKYAVVVRLKGGDPMLFGRAQEEIEALAAARVACEVVPGVTSALAASAEIGVSLTRRGVSRSVTFATPRVGEGEDTSDWAPSVASADTAVLYMAAGKAAEIARVLEGQGMSPATPVIIVENASLAEARQIGTTLRGLSESAELQIHGPALLFFGEVYRQRAHALIAAALLEDQTTDELPQRRALPR